MTLLLRRISSRKVWNDTFVRKSAGSATLPLWAHAEFVPTHRDQDGLSVFELHEEDRTALLKLGSAFSMINAEEGPHLFVGVAPTNLSSAGLNVRSTTGHTFDDEVNGWHREIQVTSMQDVAAVTRLFVAGEAHVVERQKAFKQMKLQAEAGRIRLVEAFGRREATASRRATTQLIEEGAAIVVPPRPTQERSVEAK